MLGWAAYRQSLAHRGAGKMGANCQNQTPMALLRRKAISPLFPVALTTAKRGGRGNSNQLLRWIV